MLVPAVVAAWLLVAFAGASLLGPVEEAFCAPENYREGICYGDDAQLALAILMNAFIGISALVVEATAIAMAPSHRRKVAWAVFAVGACIAIALGFAMVHDFGDFHSSHWDYVASAIGAGLAGLVVIDRRLRRIDAAPNP